MSEIFSHVTAEKLPSYTGPAPAGPTIDPALPPNDIYPPLFQYPTPPEPQPATAPVSITLSFK